MSSTLLAVPNVSEGRDRGAIDAIGQAFRAGGARVLDVHSDADHHRTVYTLAGERGALAHALIAGFDVATATVDVRDGRGQHPHVGGVDVAPIVHIDGARRGAACAEALLLADLIGQRLRVPVFLYGALGGGRARAELRRGGVAGLAARVESGALRPDFGPSRPHESAGATLVAARPPLVAFNLELAPPAGVKQAEAVAARVREGGEEGLVGLRAIGIGLRREGADEQAGGRAERPAVTEDVSGERTDSFAASEDAISVGGAAKEIAQVSMNVECPAELPLRTVVERVSDAADAVGAQLLAAELVGLVPVAALEGFPADLHIRGFDPARHVIENVIE